MKLAVQKRVGIQKEVGEQRVERIGGERKGYGTMEVIDNSRREQEKRWAGGRNWSRNVCRYKWNGVHEKKEKGARGFEMMMRDGMDE